MADDSSEKPKGINKEDLLRQCGRGNFQSVMSLLENCQNDEINKDRRWLGRLLECAVQWSKPDVVQILLKKFQVNINSECSITGLGFGSALIAAIRCNNMVKDLINMGADVNLVTDVTPLIEACRWGDLTVVKKLLKRGADVNVTTPTGYTPLMAASWKRGGQAIEITKCLLAHGAEYDSQNDAGNTALHKAVVRGKAKTVKILLKCRAKILPNELGFTPLFLAVNYKRNKIFDMFQSSQYVTKKDKVEALEHKAASLAPDDMKGMYHLLRQAMETRYEDASNVLRKPIHEPVPAFGNVCESQTLHELKTRKGKNDVLLMECLAIEDRLLGRHSICLTKNFHKIWRKLLYAGLYDRALSLVEYATESFSERTAKFIFMAMLESASKIPISANHMLHAAERGLQCVIKVLKGILRSNRFSYNWLFDTELLCLKLLNTCIELDVTDKKQRAQLQAKCVMDSFSSSNPLYPAPLHAATYFVLNEKTHFDNSVYRSLVDFLIECGADINKKDHQGKVILAWVLQSYTSKDDRREIVDFLLEHSANPAYLGKDPSFPCDCTNDADILQLLRPYYPLPLQHIAAFAAVNNRIQYEGQISGKLAKFIDGHKWQRKSKPSVVVAYSVL